MRTFEGSPSEDKESFLRFFSESVRGENHASVLQHGQYNIL